MQQAEMAEAIGHLRGSVQMLERTMARDLGALRRELMDHVQLLHRLIKQGSGHNGGRQWLRWLNLAGMGLTFAGSVLGLLKPEVAGAILRALGGH